MRKITLVLASFLMLALGACADQIAGTQAGKQTTFAPEEIAELAYGTEGRQSPFNQSVGDYSGITGISVAIPNFRDSGETLVVEMVNGKEYEDIAVAMPIGPNGETLTFNAAAVAGFTGQQIAAVVQQAIVSETGETIRAVTPQIRDVILSLIEGLCQVSGSPTCTADALGAIGDLGGGLGDAVSE